MPQFDFSTYSSQIFWLLVCFGTFFSFVKFYFLPKMDETLAERNENIDGKIAEAKRIAEDASNVESQAVAFAKKTSDEVHTIISTVEFDAKHEYDQAIRETSESCREMVAKAIEKIEKETADHSEIDAASYAVAGAILKKLGIEISTEEIKKMYNEAK